MSVNYPDAKKQRKSMSKKEAHYFLYARTQFVSTAIEMATIPLPTTFING